MIACGNIENVIQNTETKLHRTAMLSLSLLVISTNSKKFAMLIINFISVNSYTCIHKWPLKKGYRPDDDGVMVAYLFMFIYLMV